MKKPIYAFLTCACILVAGAPIAATAQFSPQSTGGATDKRAGSYFSTNGARIFYQVAGQGEPLLLIHGFPLSGALFENVRQDLSRHFKVITPDLPGFGKSTLGSAKGGDDNYAREMLALLDHLGVRTAVIGGHSMGGQIVLNMYKRSADRFDGMILFDTNPKKASVVEAAEFPAFARQASAEGVPSITPIIVPQMITGPTLLKDKSQSEEMTGIIEQASLDGLRAGGSTLADRPDYTAVLPRIKVPTLVIAGVDDQIYAPPISMAIAKAVPNASLVIVPASAHAPMFERPAFVTKMLLKWADLHRLGST